MIEFTWSRFQGYECSTRGDPRFSAFKAKLYDGRTIEEWYQCYVKGYASTQQGKGKPPLHPLTREVQWELYLALWKLWAINNLGLMRELRTHALEHGGLSDRFATTDINQARALVTILNEW